MHVYLFLNVMAEVAQKKGYLMGNIEGRKLHKLATP